MGCALLHLVLIFGFGFAGLPMDVIDKCMGDPEADAENEVLKTEQIVQVVCLTC
jgi:hypothetical protein